MNDFNSLLIQHEEERAEPEAVLPGLFATYCHLAAVCNSNSAGTGGETAEIVTEEILQAFQKAIQSSMLQ